MPSPGTVCAAASHVQPRQRTLAFRDGDTLRITEIPGARLYSVSAVNHFSAAARRPQYPALVAYWRE